MCLVSLGLAASLGAADICGAIRSLVAAEAKKQDIPAISVAAVQKHQVICSVALGWADLEQRVPNTDRSRHRLASLSKPVTAVLTMRFAEEGRIGLDESVRNVLPELPSAYAPVTVRHLLSHQSGIREYLGMAEVFSTQHYTNLSEAARAIFLGSPLLFKPGLQTAYTTYGYTLLGAALERVTGQSFREILESRLHRFGLDDSLALRRERVRPYRKLASRGWENTPPFDASNKYPGGGA